MTLCDDRGATVAEAGWHREGGPYPPSPEPGCGHGYRKSAALRHCSACMQVRIEELEREKEQIASELQAARGSTADEAWQLIDGVIARLSREADAMRHSPRKPHNQARRSSE